jgi:hypothetical protein
MADVPRISSVSPGRHAVSMFEPAAAPALLTIDRVERSRAKKDQVRLRVSGHWSVTEPAELDAMLVVQAHGRRHRFAAGRDKHAAADATAASTFVASFTIPDWAVPEQPGQAVLWVGDVVVAVPPPGSAVPAPSAGPADVAPAGVVPVAEESVEAPLVGSALIESAPREPLDPLTAAEAGRAGPLADLLFKETITALHGELEQRAVELARLRGELAQTRSELRSRSGPNTGLEAAHALLREELQRLTGAVAQQREEFEAHAAALVDERDEARREASAAAQRLERERADADTRLTDARESFDDHLATARSEFDQQLAATRTEAEQEMSRNRAETEAMFGAARSQADSRAGAAEAEAASLGRHVAALTAAERQRAQEAAVLREQLAGAHIARDAAFTEVEGLRAELERLAAELAVAREQSAAAGGELSEAEELLAEARALTQRLRGESSA